MSKWKYIYESVCNPCEECDEPYGFINDSKLFDTKEEAEAYLEKSGGEKHNHSSYANTDQYIIEVVE